VITQTACSRAPTSPSRRAVRRHPGSMHYRKVRIWWNVLILKNLSYKTKM